MKLLLTAFLLTCFQYTFAQDKSVLTDSVANKISARKNNLFIKLNSVNSYGLVKPGAKYYNFKSMFGTGGELIVGFKLYEKTALGFGFQRTKFFLDQSKVDKGLMEVYNQPWLPANVTAFNNSSLKQNAYFIYLSGWKQRARSVFEYYTKICLTSFAYNLNSVVNRTSFSIYSISTSFEGGIPNTGFITSAGINYSKQLSKIFYVAGGVQYSYNITPKTYLYEKNIYSTGTEATHQIQLPTPSHILQINIGVMYKPYKPCNCKEQKPW